jgi:hypothetical protein
MTRPGLPAGNGRVRAVPGAMLTVMAACPPAPEPHDPGLALRGWAVPAAAERIAEGLAELRVARREAATVASSSVGQVRALAWLLGLRGPTLSAYTCSRLAAGAAGAGGYYAALSWLCAAGVDAAAADRVAGLVWPGERRAAGGVAGRVGPRRRPEDVGSGAAGISV